MSNQTAISRIVEDAYATKDPQVYAAMQMLLVDVYRIYNDRFPAPIVSSNLSGGGALTAADVVSGFTGILYGNNLHLTWNTVEGAVAYELRLGANWATGQHILTTQSLQADINPLQIPFVYGTFKFFIKAFDSLGVYSSTASEFDVTISTIPAPTVTASIIGNNVLLKWNTPASILNLDHYIVSKNGVAIGQITGTFDVLFEIVAGTFNYTVTAVDIVGNQGLPSAIITVVLGSPTDFGFFARLVSTLNGTKVKCVLDSDATLFAPIDDAQTYQTHFTGPGYANWQDPINAGFPLYFEPGPNLAATYTETFDFGAISNSVIVNLDYNTTRLHGSVSITTTISVSTDNITYDAPVAGATRYVAAVRWVRVVVTFTPVDNISSVNFYNFTCVLNVHRETDAGSVAALLTDVAGTAVAFNKTFKSIDSVTLVPQTNVSCKAVYNNLTATGFNVFVFDDAGARVSKTVTWIARGVL